MELDEDQVLIMKTLAGDKKAFEELMRKYEKKIFSFVIRMVRNEETAIDLTQDFFIKVFTVLDKYNFEYKFSTWAYRICYNQVIDHIRKNPGQVHSLDDDSISAKDMLWPASARATSIATKSLPADSGLGEGSKRSSPARMAP